MIHPATELRISSPEIGYGVFATAPIPAGTVVYVQDCFDIELTPGQFAELDDLHRELADKYSYIDARGNYILSWDLARFVNHRCDCNTISTGYGFEIAIRDIAVSEEITDDYGLFNLSEPFPLNCNCPNCRGWVRPDDLERYHETWDAWVQSALTQFPLVEQPLWGLVEPATQQSLMAYLNGEQPYRSVMELRFSGISSEPLELPTMGNLPVRRKNRGRRSRGHAA